MIKKIFHRFFMEKCVHVRSVFASPLFGEGLLWIFLCPFTHTYC